MTSTGERIRLDDDVTRAVAGTRLYLPDDALDVTPDEIGAGAVASGAGRVEVTNETTLEAAQQLAGADLACLVFASAKNPGGGFLTGAQAQEESVARASALYACLTAVPEFYAPSRHRAAYRKATTAH